MRSQHWWRLSRKRAPICEEANWPRSLKGGKGGLVKKVVVKVVVKVEGGGGERKERGSDYGRERGVGGSWSWEGKREEKEEKEKAQKEGTAVNTYTPAVHY